MSNYFQESRELIEKLEFVEIQEGKVSNLLAASGVITGGAALISIGIFLKNSITRNFSDKWSFVRDIRKENPEFADDITKFVDMQPWVIGLSEDTVLDFFRKHHDSNIVQKFTEISVDNPITFFIMLLTIFVTIIGATWILGKNLINKFKDNNSASQINNLIIQKKEALVNEKDPLVIQQLNSEIGFLMAKSTMLTSHKF